MASRVTTAAVLSAILLFSAACFGGGGGEASEAELVDTLLTSSSRDDAFRAAEELAAGPGCTAAQRVARTSNERARALLRDRYAALARGPASDPATRSHALLCVAEFDDEVAARVVAHPLLTRSDPQVRATAAKALPTMRRSAPSVVDRLAAHGSRTEVGPRAKELSRVLAAIGAPAVPALLPRILESDWAIDTLVLIGKPAVPPLRSRFRDGSFRVSAAAATALLRLRKTEPILVRSLVPEIVDAMIERLGSLSVQLEAMDVLAEAGRPAVDPLVAWARKDPISLSDRERRIQGSAELALATIGARSAKAVAPLLAALRRRDYGLIADLAGFYIQLGLGEKELVAGLDSQGDIPYLFDLISSGNRRLDRAAREWAPRHGYTITGQQGGPGAWGQLELGKG